MKEKELYLSECRAMVYLPTDAIEIQITATLYQNGEIVECSKTLSNKDIQKAFRDAEINYCEDTDTFVITDKGRMCIDEQKK